MAECGRLFIGIDAGTGGVRALAVTETGAVVARSAAALEPGAVTREGNTHEQSPRAWWNAVCQATAALMSELKSEGVLPESLSTLAVDGTSGTLAALDGSGEPVRPAVMYNDARASAEADELNALAGDFCRKLGYRFKASFTLAKIVWLQKHEPEHFERATYLIHQADYILGRLSGRFGISDYSNALKTGYDLIEERWPDWIGHLPGVSDRLPRVVPPGTAVGEVCPAAAKQTGLPAGLTVVTGASDGTAGFLASGATRPGDYNTTLGTTLVFKGVSRQLCKHPDGLIYCHKLPGGYWLPGAASNTGCEWIGSLFPEDNVASMDEAARGELPVGSVAYPLARMGERFPFSRAGAQGFCVPEPADRVTRYAAHLQGVALLERLAYQVLDEVAGTSAGSVFSTGGGSGSDVWMQCRADATGRTFHRPACPESAFGSAILAAAGAGHVGVWEALNRMVHAERTFVPNCDHAERYHELFGSFRAELVKRGYL